MDRGRLEAFSDGVFAVAITLLALNLTVAGPGRVPLQHQLWEHRWSFAAYGISFFTIGIIWVNHHVMIRTIAVVDRMLLFLNLVLLMFVVLIPFATGTVAEYLSVSLGGQSTQVAMVLYAAVFLGMSVGFGAIFEWTLHGGHRVQPLPPQAHWPARLRFVAGGGVYAASMVIALFSPIAAFVLMGLVAAYYMAERTPSTAAAGSGAGPQSAGP